MVPLGSDKKRGDGHPRQTKTAKNLTAPTCVPGSTAEWCGGYNADNENQQQDQNPDETVQKKKKLSPGTRGDAHVLGRDIDAGLAPAHPNGDVTLRPLLAVGEDHRLADVQVDQVLGQPVTGFRGLFFRWGGGRVLNAHAKQKGEEKERAIESGSFVAPMCPTFVL